jgi:hypothetical protein
MQQAAGTLLVPFKCMHATKETAGPSDKQLPVLKVRRRWFAAIFWIVFGVGLLLQYFTPPIKTARDAFVISPISDEHATHPAEIVARARKVQLLSAIFTVTGALGLGFYYRVDLVNLARPRYR